MVDLAGVPLLDTGVEGASFSEASEGFLRSRDTAVCWPGLTGVVLPEGVLCPLASRWVGFVSPLDSLTLLSHSLSLVIPEMLNSEESSSGLLCSDFLDASWEVGLGSRDISRFLEADLSLSLDWDLWEREPT